MEIVVARKIKTYSRTIGELSINGVKKYFTCEDKVREIPGVPVAKWKVKGETAIPKGKYPLILSFSNRFQRILPELLGVPGFAGIRIHNGNTEKDTEGCILIGLGKMVGGVTNSIIAMEDLMPILQEAWDKKEPIIVKIGDAGDDSNLDLEKQAPSSNPANAAGNVPLDKQKS